MGLTVIFDQKRPANSIQIKRRFAWRRGQLPARCIRILLVSALTLAYGGVVIAEPSGGIVDSGEGESLKIDLQRFLSGTDKPANPITPMPPKTTTPKAITPIPEPPRRNASKKDGFSWWSLIAETVWPSE